MHFNIQGITNKAPLLELLISEMQISLNIICFTEHWLAQAELQLFPINNFIVKSYFTRSLKKRGGCCILVDKNLRKVESYKELENLSIEMHFECSAVKLNDESIVVVCIYKTPVGDLEIFFKQLQKCLSVVSNKKSYKKVIICGDFNIDTLHMSA